MGRTRQEDVWIEQRRQQVGELYVKGSTQSQIARELGVAQSTVSADLKAIRREWRDSRVRDFDEAVAVELKKLDHLEREAWSGWERSQQPAESTKVSQDGAGKRAERIVKQQQGDPRYLEQVHRCITGRRTLLGLDAPTRIAPTIRDRHAGDAQRSLEWGRLLPVPHQCIPHRPGQRASPAGCGYRPRDHRHPISQSVLAPMDQRRGPMAFSCFT